jgi:lipopolysaccharide assembly outer membrane protein LptD (OstA)
MKKYLYIFIALMFLSGVVFVIIESGKISLLNMFLPEKIATFSNVHMSGTEGTNEAWEIWAKEAWTGRDKFSTTFEHVSKANIVKNKKVMIKNLKARRIKVARNRDIEVFKSVDNDPNGGKYMYTLIDFNAISKKPKKDSKISTLTADYLKFNPTNRKAFINGHIKIVKDKLTATTETISLDLDTNIATFETRSYFVKEGSRLASNKAVADFDDEIIEMSGSIEVHQKNKSVTSESALYNDNEKCIILTTGVVAVIEKPKSLIKEASAKKYSNDESKEALVTRTILTCDRLKIMTENNDAFADGNVHVTQKDKEAKADKADYSEDKQEIVLTGNCFMKKKNDWVKADKVIVAVDKEMFEAIGQAETTFTVKKTKRKI